MSASSVRMRMHSDATSPTSMAGLGAFLSVPVRLIDFCIHVKLMSGSRELHIPNGNLRSTVGLQVQQGGGFLHKGRRRLEQKRLNPGAQAMLTMLPGVCRRARSKQVLLRGKAWRRPATVAGWMKFLKICQQERKQGRTFYGLCIHQVDVPVMTGREQGREKGRKERSRQNTVHRMWRTEKWIMV